MATGFIPPPPSDLDRSASNYNGVCWHCGHKSEDGKWLGMPVSYNREYRECYIEGFFCSLTCMLAHIEYFTVGSQQEDLRILFHLYCIINHRLEVFEPAQPRWVLQLFGGTMKIEAYRQTGGIRQYRPPADVLARSPQETPRPCRRLTTTRLASRAKMRIKKIPTTNPRVLPRWKSSELR